ncbi:hypothetical protein C5167_026451 [Papaver somniferum]|nr:hypothetical protein C5167_026451 [Papaver somniferum]
MDTIDSYYRPSLLSLFAYSSVISRAVEPKDYLVQQERVTPVYVSAASINRFKRTDRTM